MVVDRNWDMSDVAAFYGPTTREKAVDLLLAERDRQDAKWGDQSDLPRERMMVVLMEEVGEASEAVLGNGQERDLLKELTHVAAVAVQMMEHELRRQETTAATCGKGE